MSKILIIVTITILFIIQPSAQGGKLHDAAWQGNLDACKNEIAYGADVNTFDEQKQTPLHHAAWGAKNNEICKLLLDHGAHVNVQDKTGNTPLHYALVDTYGTGYSPEETKKIIALCSLLLDHGANIGLKNSAGQIPVDWASEGSIKDFLTERTAGKTLNAQLSKLKRNLLSLEHNSAASDRDSNLQL